MKEKSVEKEKECWVIFESYCYERTKAVQGWSPNQFAVNASEFPA